MEGALSTEIENNVCTKCWGTGTTKGGPKLNCGYGYGTCSRCEGTGQEPPISWWPIVAMFIIFAIGLYLIGGL